VSKLGILKIIVEGFFSRKVTFVNIFIPIFDKFFRLNEKVSKGKIIMPDDDVQTALYDTCLQVMENAGYVQYEISNFALFGMECKHNINYWMGGDYIGVGPGAAGRLSNTKNNICKKRKFFANKKSKKMDGFCDE